MAEALINPLGDYDDDFECKKVLTLFQLHTCISLHIIFLKNIIIIYLFRIRIEIDKGDPMNSFIYIFEK